MSAIYNGDGYGDGDGDGDGYGDGYGNGDGYGDGYGYGYGDGDGHGNGYGDGNGVGNGIPEQEIGGARPAIAAASAREGFAGLTIADVVMFALGGAS